MWGNHWTCFYIKGDKFYYSHSFRGEPVKFLLNQLSKPKTYHSYKTQDINSRLSGKCCWYFIYLTDRMNCYDTFSKILFV